MPPCPLCNCAPSREFAHLHQSHYFICPDCQLIFLHPRQRLAPLDERARYETHQNSASDPGYRAFLTPLVEAVAQELTPGSQGLDFGSGPGPAIPSMMEERGYKVTTFDPFFSPDPSVLRRSYDFIICSETLEHLFDPLSELRRLDALLKDDGLIGVMTQFFDDPGRFEKSHYHRDPTHVGFYSRMTLEFVAKKLDWEGTFPRQNVALFRKKKRGLS